MKYRATYALASRVPREDVIARAWTGAEGITAVSVHALPGVDLYAVAVRGEADDDADAVERARAVAAATVAAGGGMSWGSLSVTTRQGRTVRTIHPTRTA